MEIPFYLAMTASEFAGCSTLPQKAAWMACHFSPYGTGLTNLPTSLPTGSILILNDRIPILHHDQSRITEQLHMTIDAMNCSALLLDFQQQDVEKLQDLTIHLTGSLPCPVASTQWYARDHAGPVFLPPCPHHVHLEEHIRDWNDREIWLDLAIDSTILTLTPDGSRESSLPPEQIPDCGFHDDPLHCHYKIETGEDFARFTLWRTTEDLSTLSQEADRLGIRLTVGLYQEWAEAQKPACLSADRF